MAERLSMGLARHGKKTACTTLPRFLQNALMTPAICSLATLSEGSSSAMFGNYACLAAEEQPALTNSE